MEKRTLRKYGPKPRPKDRDTTAKRYVARRAAFGDPKTGRPASPSSHVPRGNSASFRPSPLGYKPREAARSAGSAYAKRPYSRVPAASLPVEKVYVRPPGEPSHFRKAGFSGKDSRPPFVKKPWSAAKIARPAYGPKKLYVKRDEAITKKKYPKSVKPNKPRVASASWGKVASWYDAHLSSPDTYHEKVILPNLLRLINAQKGDMIADLACGQGIIAKALTEAGAKVTGVDVAPELIAIAEANVPKATFQTGDATSLPSLKDSTFNKALMNLAIQNIEDTAAVMSEAARILKTDGTFHVVMNHPAFRIPKQSAWGYDDKKKVQWRRIDEYLSNSKASIDMHPGFEDSPQTLSFHRPLQYYFKAFAKAGFAVTRLEEWISHKESDSGPRAKAENHARKEFPLFLYMEAQKIPRK